MHIAFTTLPVPSGCEPAVAPLAAAASRAGHRVTIATASSPPGEFAGELVAAAERDSGPPDVLVREATEFGGYLAAEYLGVPLAVLDDAPFAATLPPLNEARTAFGLPAVDDPRHADGALRIGLLPEAWYPVRLLSPSLRTYRIPDLGPHEPLDAEIAELPPDRPLVLAELRTLPPDPGKPLADLVEALAGVDARTVLVLGAGHEDPGVTVPDNVYPRASVPRRDLLAACDLYLTDAAFGGVAAAVATGTPMVALPLGGEHDPNARRLAELGMGLRLDPGAVDASTLAGACHQVLDEPRFARRTRALRRAALADPGVDVLLADLAALPG